MVRLLSSSTCVGRGPGNKPLSNDIHMVVCYKCINILLNGLKHPAVLSEQASIIQPLALFNKQIAMALLSQL